MSENKSKKKISLTKSLLFEKIIVYCSFIFIFTIILFIISRNNFLILQQSIEETASNIDIQLKLRFDLLTKLLDAAKLYMKFEKNTLIDIISLRCEKNKSINDISKKNNDLNLAFKEINFLLENYPNLKSNNTILELQSSAKDCEDNIAAARRFYNANVKLFNSKISIFPSNVVASHLNLNLKKYFISSENDRLDIKIN